MSRVFIVGSVFIGAFAIWMLWTVWWYTGRPLVLVMVLGGALGLARALYRRGL